MNASFERSTSVWGKSADSRDAPALSTDASADAVVVGAGLAGLSVAYELACAGRSVVVLDRGPIGGGMTARTTAHLASELDDYYHELIDLRGLDEAQQVYRAQAAAIDRIETIARQEGITCDFKRLDGYLFLGPGADPAVLDRELEAARQVGLTGVAWAERAPIPGRDAGRCLRFPDQGRFHPLKYLDGLARCIRRNGGRLHADTIVIGVEEEGEEVPVTRDMSGFGSTRSVRFVPEGSHAAGGQDGPDHRCDWVASSEEVELRGGSGAVGHERAALSPVARRL